VITLLLLILPPLIGFVLIILGAIWATNALMHRVVGKKHRLIEEIVTTGQVPPAWARKPLFSRQQPGTIRRLDDLIRYAQNSPLVGDEETREILLSKLLAVRAEWSGGHPAATASLSQRQN
jgi:hypothetical protein